MDIFSNLIILIVLLMLSGFFSGAETALISLRPAQVRNMVNTGRKGAGLVERVKANPQQLLITILIGNNVVNIGASVLATVMATELFGHESIALLTGVLTLAILIFGEIIPKTFCHKYAETFSLIAALPVLVLEKVFFPLIWLMGKLIAWVNRYFGIKHGKEGVVSEEELLAMVDMSAEEGTLEISEAEMIDRAMGFGDILVQQVMTPRAEVCGIEENQTVRKTLETMIHKGLHSRLPVYRETMDQPVGVVTIREISQLYMDPNTIDKKLKELKLSPAIVVPITQPIERLYHEFRVKKQHLALVLDENGTVVGLVTMEDVVEEVMGEIQDETDTAESHRIIQLGENSWSASGDLELQEFEKATNIWLGSDSDEITDEERRKSLSLLFIENFQRIPKVGKTVLVNNCNLTIESLDRYKINRIRIDLRDNG
ncbi:MAG: hemolysin family protein [Nitrospinota bacterium]|nr:hemolysin family protein [Nitrospinota bacterium]